MPTNKKLFLSAVSSEFESYRKLLRDDLKRPTLDVNRTAESGRIRRPSGYGLEMMVRQKNWMQSAVAASNLSGLELKLGLLTNAVSSARRSIDYADRSRDDLPKYIPASAR